jgi:ABC-type glutathione transport system ATPase component
MIIVTHEVRFAREVADRILFMDAGIVVEEGPPAQLLDHPVQDRTRRFLRMVGHDDSTHPSRRPQLQMRGTLLMTKRKPATAGEILVKEFLQPMKLSQAALATAMGVQRKHANELCTNRRALRRRPRLSSRVDLATVPISG